MNTSVAVVGCWLNPKVNTTRTLPTTPTTITKAYRVIATAAYPGAFRTSYNAGSKYGAISTPFISACASSNESTNSWESLFVVKSADRKLDSNISLAVRGYQELCADVESCAEMSRAVRGCRVIGDDCRVL